MLDREQIAELIRKRTQNHIDSKEHFSRLYPTNPELAGALAGYLAPLPGDTWDEVEESRCRVQEELARYLTDTSSEFGNRAANLILTIIEHHTIVGHGDQS